jgi:hypothetical protein
MGEGTAVGEPVRWVMTVVFAAVIVTCLLRLASTRRDPRPDGVPGRHEDLGHIVMAVSMIAMVLSWMRLLPTMFWVLLFTGQALCFAVVLLRGSSSRQSRLSQQDNWDHTHHLMASVGMVYMVIAMGGSADLAGMTMSGSTGMAGMVGSSWSPLTGAFGLYFLVYAGWSLLRATVLAPSVASAGWSGLPLVLSRPLAVHGCRALMGGGMAYVLLSV